MTARHATIADLPLDFCDVPPGAAQEALDLMAPLVSAAKEWAMELHRALASHWLVLNPATKGAGPGMASPVERRIDKLQVHGVDASEFLTPYSLKRTRWGQLYLDLSTAHCTPAMMVV